MYSITNSPGMALDLAHAMQDEHRRQASPTRRTPKQPKVDRVTGRRTGGRRGPGRGARSRWRDVQSTQPEPATRGRGLGAVRRPELGQDPRHVDRDRLRGHEQLGCDLPVAPPLGHQAEHLDLAGGQRSRACSRSHRPDRQPAPPGHRQDLVAQRLRTQLDTDARGPRRAPRWRQSRRRHRAPPRRGTAGRSRRRTAGRTPASPPPPAPSPRPCPHHGCGLRAPAPRPTTPRREGRGGPVVRRSP